MALLQRMDTSATLAFADAEEVSSGDEAAAEEDFSVDISPDEEDLAAVRRVAAQRDYIIPLSLEQREALCRIDNHLYMKAAVLLLVFADLVLLICELSIPEGKLNETAAKSVGITILGLLLAEVLLRLLYLDFKAFFFNAWCVFDFVVTVVSLALELTISEFGRYFIILRALRTIRVLVIATRTRAALKKTLRKHISYDRRRYLKDGFDLDITYITKRIIAMSVPAVKRESAYRNPVGEVARFFNTKHEGRYRIYHLNPERKYPYDKFNNQVVQYFMGDHNPAPLKMIVDFCHNMDEFLAADPENVSAVHCKGGKGRTGTMICSYLMWTGECKDADEALQFFGARRTSDQGNFQGVESPSQERYVRYMERLLREGPADPALRVIPEARQRKLKRIRVHGMAAVAGEEWQSLYFVVCQGLTQVMYDHRDEKNREALVVRCDDENDAVDFILGKPLKVCDDIRIRFQFPPIKKPVFHYWFNTSYESANPFSLLRDEVGGVRKCKLKKPNRFGPNFRVETFFTK